MMGIGKVVQTRGPTPSRPLHSVNISVSAVMLCRSKMHLTTQLIYHWVPSDVAVRPTEVGPSCKCYPVQQSHAH